MDRMMKMKIERIHRHYEDGDNVSWRSDRRNGEKPKVQVREGSMNEECRWGDTKKQACSNMYLSGLLRVAQLLEAGWRSNKR